MTERKVLIRGYVFDYAEKAPFVVSGMSVLGAIEYDQANDLLRCHECGEWFGSVASHLKSHDLSALEYKRRHGLNARASLISRTQRTNAALVATERVSIANLTGTEGWRAGHESQSARAAATVTSPRTPRTRIELRNVRGKCQAQILFRIQVTAAELKRTPTCKELKQRGISPSVMIDAFGSIESAIRKAGLDPNPAHNHYGKSKLPENFPSKEKLLETRMPWPSDYFGIRVASRSPEVA